MLLTFDPMYCSASKLWFGQRPCEQRLISCLNHASHSTQIRWMLFSLALNCWIVCSCSFWFIARISENEKKCFFEKSSLKKFLIFTQYGRMGFVVALSLYTAPPSGLHDDLFYNSLYLWIIFEIAVCLLNNKWNKTANRKTLKLLSQKMAYLELYFVYNLRNMCAINLFALITCNFKHISYQDHW